jgi:hypothetical protein
MKKMKSILVISLLLICNILLSATKTWKNNPTNNNFNTPSNWIGNILPVNGDTIIIPSTTNKNPRISTNSYTFGKTIIQTGKSLTLATNNFINLGTCTGGGTIVTVSDLDLSATFYNITLDIQSNITTTNLTIDLDNTLIISNGGNLSGNIKITKNIGKYRTHYISFPVKTTYNSLTDDCDVINPNNTNINTNSRLFYLNNTTQQWVRIKQPNLIDSTNNTLGYSNFFYDLSSTNTTKDYIVDMEGYYNHLDTVYLSKNLTTFNGKYILVPNPKIVNLDWESVINENSNASLGGIYFWNNLTSSYISYIDGISSDGTQLSDNIIPPMQSFMLYIDSSNVSNELMINQNVLALDFYPQSLARTASFNRNIIRFSNGEQSTVLCISDLAQDDFKYYEDTKLLSKNSKYIYTNYGGINYMINQIPDKSQINFTLVSNDSILKIDYDGSKVVTVNDIYIQPNLEIKVNPNDILNIQVLSLSTTNINNGVINNNYYKYEIYDSNTLNLVDENSIIEGRLYIYKYYFKDGSTYQKKIVRK